jgi:tetratricopeptide (TPR) repeat protein
MKIISHLFLLLALIFTIACNSGDREKSRALDILGQQHVERGDFLGAIPLYDEAIKLNPRDGFIYFNRGAARLQTGDYEGAIADFTQVIRLEPKLRSDAYQARGIAKNSIGDQKGAQEDWMRRYTGDK